MPRIFEYSPSLSGVSWIVGSKDWMPLGNRHRRSAEFLRESDEEPFRPADIAEAIRVFILHDFAYEPGAAFVEPRERLVDVVHGEHDA